MFRCDGCATIGCLLLFHTVHGSNDKVPTSMGPCIARARASASPPGGTSLLARASRAPSQPKRSEQIAGRARAPPTELRRPNPPRCEAPAKCRGPSRSTFTARVSSRYPRSSVKCQVETCTGAGPSRNNVEQCLGVMVVQPSGVYCCSIRFMDHVTKSRPVWARPSRARARQPRLPGVRRC